MNEIELGTSGMRTPQIGFGCSALLGRSGRSDSLRVLDVAWDQGIRFFDTARAYGYGASMGAWILDYLAGWAGEWGQIVHSRAQYRGPAFTGDVTVMTGEIIDKTVDEAGRHVVQVECKMANQLGITMATAKAEIELPQK